MCHPDNQEYMPVEKTWGIMPLFGRCPAGLNFVYYLCHIGLIVPFLQLETVQRWLLNSGVFLEKIFRIKLAERTWVKLVTFDIIHWYCDGLKPNTIARRYNSQARRRKSVAHYFFYFIYSSLPNSFFLSVLMQKWKMARGGPLSSNRLLHGRSRREACLPRERVQPTRPLRGNCRTRLTVFPRNLRWRWG